LGSALLSRILNQPLFKGGIRVITPRHISVEPFLTDPRVYWSHPSAIEQADEAPPDVILLAIKPYQAASVLPLYRRFVPCDTLVITALAMTPFSFYTQYLGDHVRLVRIMPNTPAAIGQGVTLAYTPCPLSEEQKTLTDNLLTLWGHTYWMTSEEKFDQGAVLTGSGPAYLFRFIEALAAAAQQFDFSAEVALEMTQKMIIGACHYLEYTQKPPAELRAQVTSPGGITAAALAVLNAEDQLDQLFARALQAAWQHTVFLKTHAHS
jgi:pyrroline-5-carboxylate reductase